MKFETAIAHYGRQADIARALQVSTAAVAHWQKKGVVPFFSAGQLETLTNGALRRDPSLYDRFGRVIAQRTKTRTKTDAHRKARIRATRALDGVAP